MSLREWIEELLKIFGGILDSAGFSNELNYSDETVEIATKIDVIGVPTTPTLEWMIEHFPDLSKGKQKHWVKVIEHYQDFIQESFNSDMVH